MNNMPDKIKKIIPYIPHTLIVIVVGLIGFIFLQQNNKIDEVEAVQDTQIETLGSIKTDIGIIKTDVSWIKDNLK